MKRLTQYLSALGEETRLRIVRMLQHGEMSLGDIVKQLKLSQGAVSHHVKILRQAGLVVNRREGKRILYSLNQKAVFRLYQNLQSLFASLSQQREC